MDSFPYLMQAGVAERHVAEAARMLRPGGALAILNLSYRILADVARRFPLGRELRIHWSAMERNRSRYGTEWPFCSGAAWSMMRGGLDRAMRRGDFARPTRSATRC